MISIIITIITLVILMSFLAGYVIGRKSGIKEGRELGILYAPLMIRSFSLKEGQCQICMSAVDCHKLSSMIK